jgi:hypothetical protein
MICERREEILLIYIFQEFINFNSNFISKHFYFDLVNCRNLIKCNMDIINPNSLSITLDNINEIYFYGRKISASDKAKAAKWIASRRGLPRSYWNMFAPTEYDYNNGIRLFTGEKITTGAGTSHILGEEACRALLLLNGKDKKISAALDNAFAGLAEAMNNAKNKNVDYPDGYYCCGTCTSSYWRNLDAQNTAKAEKLINAGIKILKSMRDGKGKWRRFPYYYTLYTIHDIDLKSVIEEMEYAAPGLERYVKRAASGDKYNERKRMLAERVLERV